MHSTRIALSETTGTMEEPYDYDAEALSGAVQFAPHDSSVHLSPHDPSVHTLTSVAVQGNGAPCLLPVTMQAANHTRS